MAGYNGFYIRNVEFFDVVHHLWCGRGVSHTSLK